MASSKPPKGNTACSISTLNEPQFLSVSNLTSWSERRYLQPLHLAATQVKTPDLDSQKATKLTIHAHLVQYACVRTGHAPEKVYVTAHLQGQE